MRLRSTFSATIFPPHGPLRLHDRGSRARPYATGAARERRLATFAELRPAGFPGAECSRACARASGNFESNYPHAQFTMVVQVISIVAARFQFAAWGRDLRGDLPAAKHRLANAGE